MTQPFLLLDKDLRVIAANEAYYLTFQKDVDSVDGECLHDIDEGVWNVPLLIEHLHDIFKHNTFLKGFEVNKIFPTIGKKVLILSARRVYRNIQEQEIPSEILLLAVEDVTELMRMAELIIKHNGGTKLKIPEHKVDLEKMINELETEMKQKPSPKTSKKKVAKK